MTSPQATAQESVRGAASPAVTRAAVWVVFGATLAIGLWNAGRTQIDLAMGLPVAAAAGAVWWTLIGVGYWWAFTKIPYFAPVARKPRWLGLLWGALVATTMAGVLESPFGLMTMDSGATRQGVVIAVVAGLVEESAKGLGILVVLLLVQRPRTLVDGLVIGASVGLGFELLEDLGYTFGNALQAGNDGTSGLLTVMFSRAVTSVTSHWVYSSILGVGLAYLLCARWAGTGRRVAVFVGCWALAVGPHALWDLPALGSGLFAQFMASGSKIVAAVVVVAAALLYMRWARNREGEFYVTYLVRAGGAGVPETDWLVLPHGVTRRRARKAASGKATSRGAKKRTRQAVRSVHQAEARLTVAIAVDNESDESVARDAVVDGLASLAGVDRTSSAGA